MIGFKDYPLLILYDTDNSACPLAKQLVLVCMCLMVQPIHYSVCCSQTCLWKHCTRPATALHASRFIRERRQKCQYLSIAPCFALVVRPSVRPSAPAKRQHVTFRTCLPITHRNHRRPIENWHCPVPSRMRSGRPNLHLLLTSIYLYVCTCI